MKKKINKMSKEELLIEKEKLEKFEEHQRYTKSKKNPILVKWKTNQIQSKYYKCICEELNRRN